MSKKLKPETRALLGIGCTLLGAAICASSETKEGATFGGAMTLLGIATLADDKTMALVVDSIAKKQISKNKS